MTLKEQLIYSLNIKKDQGAIVDYNENTGSICYTYKHIMLQKKENEDYIKRFQITDPGVILIFLPKCFAFASWVVTCICNDYTFIPLDDDDQSTSTRLSTIISTLPISLIVSTSDFYIKYCTTDSFLTNHPNILLLNQDGSFVFQAHQSDQYSYLCFNTLNLSLLKKSIFIINTSGTTSTPSLICHGDLGLTTRFRWIQSLLSPYSITSMVCFSLTHFIDYITVLLDSLLLHTLFYNCNQLDCAYSLLQHYDISLIRCTPSFLHLLSLYHQPLRCSSLVHLSGEQLFVNILTTLKQFMPNCLFYNIYGATETTGDCFYYDCSIPFISTTHVPIGKPIPNCSYTINQDHILIIEGPILCLGKWNQGSLSSFWTGDYCKVISTDASLDSKDDVVLDSKDDVVLDSKDNVVLDSKDDVVLDSKDDVVLDSKDNTLLNTKNNTSHNTKNTTSHNTKDTTLLNTKNNTFLIITERSIHSTYIKVNGKQMNRKELILLLQKCDYMKTFWICELSNALGLLCFSTLPNAEEKIRTWIAKTYPTFGIPYTIGIINDDHIPVEKMSEKQIQYLILKYQNTKSSHLKETQRQSSPPLKKSSYDQFLHLYEDVLNHSIDDHMDFFVSGGDSLKSIILLEYLHQHGYTECTLRDIYNYHTPASLWAFLNHHVITPLTIQEESITVKSTTSFCSTRSDSVWKELTTIPFLRCVDCDCIVIHDMIVCCCHGGLIKQFKIENNQIKVIASLTIHQRIEKSLTFYQDMILVGTYSGSVLMLEHNLEKTTEFKLSGEIRGKMGICDSIGVICTYNGYVYFFDLEKHALVSVLCINANCHCMPYVCRDKKGMILAICCTINSSIIVLQMDKHYVTSIKQIYRLKQPIFAEPLVIHNYLLITPVKDSIIILSFTTGSFKEIAVSFDGLIYSKPLYLEERDEIVFATTNGKLHIVDLQYQMKRTINIEENACILFQYRLIIDLMVPAVINANEWIVCTSTGNVYKIINNDVFPIYSCKQAIFSNPLFYDNYLYFGCRNDQIVVLKRNCSVCYHYTMQSIIIYYFIIRRKIICLFLFDSCIVYTESS